MRLIWSGAGVVTIAACLAIACNAITGVGDLEATGIPDSGAPILDSSNPNVDGQVPQNEAGSSSSGSSSSSSSSSGTAVSCTTIGGTCAPLPPDGWEGPYLVYDGSTPIKGCPPQLEDTFTLGGGTPSSTFTCPACKCQGVTGAACTATLTVWSDNTTCSDATTAGSGVDPTVCYVNSVGATISAKFRHSVTAAGKCDPALNGPPQRGAVTWTSNYLFCGSKNLTAIGCDTTNQVCLPPANGGKVCIVKEGADSCPAGWNNSAAINVFGDVNDSRACDVTGCSCGGPTGVGCTGQLYRSSPNAACTAPIIPPFATPRQPEACFTLDNGYSAKQVTAPTASGGSCAASGTPKTTGTLLPAAPGVTCCLP